jgi:hypothetical protein
MFYTCVEGRRGMEGGREGEGVGTSSMPKVLLLYEPASV